MRPLVLLREAAATAWATKVPTVLVTCLLMVMVASTLATVGRTAAAERQLADRMDAAGSRLLVVRDARNRGLIPPAIVRQVAALSASERAVGATSAMDVVSGSVGQGGQRVPAWGIVGDITAVASLTAGRWPGPGEALVSEPAMRALGFTAPFGWVAEASHANPVEFAVVGSFVPRDPFADYQAGVIFNAGTGNASTLSVILSDAGLAATAQRAVLGIIAATDPTDLAVVSPVGLSELRDDVLGDFGSFGRALLLGILLAGSVLIAIVVLADVLVRRADLGRRRALGTTRGAIVAIVTIRTLLPALLGVALGNAVGLWAAHALGAAPPPTFAAGVSILAVLGAAMSAVAPAIFAATRDPVAVLRTP